MQTYSMHFKDVLDLPIATFWMLHRNVNRIAAEKDQRNIAVFGHSFAGGDGLDDLVGHLKEEMGTAFEMEQCAEKPQMAHPVLDMEFDAEGLASLKGLGGL